MTNRFNITLSDIKQLAKTPTKEIERRRIQLWFHRFLYYEYDTQILSDYDYDKLEVEYRLLREHYTEVKVKRSCPLYCVGTEADKYTEGKVEKLINYYRKEKNEN